ncbi:hypothetical protein EAO21_28810 [Klebsiella pneumoniae]|nr:hypothetical protein EAO21_28810 [Klebsiella pneumoniae]
MLLLDAEISLPCWVTVFCRLDSAVASAFFATLALVVLRLFCRLVMLLEAEVSLPCWVTVFCSVWRAAASAFFATFALVVQIVFQIRNAGGLRRNIFTLLGYSILERRQCGGVGVDFDTICHIDDIEIIKATTPGCQTVTQRNRSLAVSVAFQRPEISVQSEPIVPLLYGRSNTG